MSNYRRLNFDKMDISGSVNQSQLNQDCKKKWNRFPDVMPPNIPGTEDFGVDYEVQYRLPNGQIETTVTEWLWEKEWNCIYPVVAWREENKIVEFPNNNIKSCDDVENER